jgi:hypothetical protein
MQLLRGDAVHNLTMSLCHSYISRAGTGKRVQQRCFQVCIAQHQHNHFLHDARLSSILLIKGPYISQRGKKVSKRLRAYAEHACVEINRFSSSPCAHPASRGIVIHVRCQARSRTVMPAVPHEQVFWTSPSRSSAILPLHHPQVAVVQKAVSSVLGCHQTE